MSISRKASFQAVFSVYVAAVLILCLGTAWEAKADASCQESDSAWSHQMIQGHIPHAVKEMNDVGTLSEDSTLPVMFALKLNNESELDSRIAEMYRPGSDTFHQFITPDEFRSRYAPTEEQINQEKAFLESNGIAVQSVSGNHVFIHAQASVANLNKAFKTEIHQYLHKNGNMYFAPAYDLQIPTESRITSVIGLHNLAHLHNHIVRSHDQSTTTSRRPPEGSAPGGGLAPSDIMQAYGVPSSLNGQGQTLALFELDGYDASDVEAYENQFNLSRVPLQNVLVDGASGSPSTGSDSGASEVTLDIEMMVALAPGASRILVYEGPTSDQKTTASFEQGYIDVIERIADDNLAQQVSSSWGSAENQFTAADLQSESVVFKQMAAQGQTFFAASGDNGAEDDGSNVTVDNPASQPYVVGVGGTKLTIATGGAWANETTWNELTKSMGAGGGGISTVWSMPDWQKPVASANDTQASQTMRNVPDVSLNADPMTGYGIYVGGKWEVVAGTSAAAPLWAAFNALVNEERQASGKSATGFLAPALYKIGQSSGYDSAFNDIVKGTNGTGDKSFSAFVGYDNATGLGSFKATGLIQQLSQ